MEGKKSGHLFVKYNNSSLKHTLNQTQKVKTLKTHLKMSLRQGEEKITPIHRTHCTTCVLYSVTPLYTHILQHTQTNYRRINTTTKHYHHRRSTQARLHLVQLLLIQMCSQPSSSSNLCATTTTTTAAKHKHRHFHSDRQRGERRTSADSQKTK